MTDEAHSDHPDHDKAGGSAFPFVSQGAIASHQCCDPGMTLRDWFAGQALARLLAHASGEDPHKSPELAYKLADDMISTRTK